MCVQRVLVRHLQELGCSGVGVSSTRRIPELIVRVGITCVTCVPR